MPRPSYGTQPENPDIPHMGPLLEVPCHSRLPDRSRMYHEQPVQPGIPVRFRSALVPFRLVYGRLPVVVAVVVDKELFRDGMLAAADKSALLHLVAYLFLASRDGLEPVGYMLHSCHVPVGAFPVESAVEQAA